MVLGESESHFDMKSHWNVCLDSNTTSSQDPERTPYSAFLISARVHLNFGECGVKKQHSMQYCECPDRSCFLWSNKANVVYLVMLLVGQHIIAAEKILQKHCKSTSAIHMLRSCQHHNKDVHTWYIQQANLLPNSTYSTVSCILKPIHGRRDHLPNTRWSSCHCITCPSKTPSSCVVAVPHRPNPLWFEWGKPCLLVFLAEGFPNRVADLQRNPTSQRSDVSQGSTYKLKSLNIKIRTNSEKKKQIPTTQQEPIDPHRASTSTCRGFILLWFPFFITSNDQTVSSFPGVASLQLFLHWLRKVSNICWLHVMHVNSSWPSFFLKEGTYWIHFCLPEVFAVKKHSKRNVKHLWLNGLLDLTTVPTAQHGLCFCGVTFHIVGLCLRCTGG